MGTEMLVRIAHNHPEANFMRQVPGGGGVWGGVKYTCEEVEECDIFLCLTHPYRDFTVRCAETWLLSLEPPARLSRWQRESYRHFDRVFTCWPDLPTPSHTCVNWFPDIDYDGFRALSPPPKTKGVSWVTSDNADLYGHRLRLRFLRFLQENGFDFSLFGRGFSQIPDKAQGLLPYRFSIAMENFRRPHYWTEKLADCFLCWTIPFYWGAPNIARYFPTGSYISIDPCKPEHSLRTIQEALAGDYYQEHLPQLAEARELVLEKYQFFPHIGALIREHFQDAEKKVRQIPACPHPRKTGGWRKFCYKVNFGMSKIFPV